MTGKSKVHQTREFKNDVISRRLKNSRILPERSITVLDVSFSNIHKFSYFYGINKK